VKLHARWSAQALDLPSHATFRCLLDLGGGDLAAGSDYGLALRRGGAWSPFPFPAGARREARRVESLALHEGALHVVSARNHYAWPFAGVARGAGFPRDAYKADIELRAVFAHPDGRLLRAWRTHLEGAGGPGDLISFATDGEQVYAGSLDGRLVVVDGPEIRRFDGPVRYLAWSDGALHVAAAGGLHTWRSGAWSEQSGEPYALHEHEGALYALRGGALWRDGLRLAIPFVRPWSLGSAGVHLAVGEVGGLSMLR